MAIRGDHRGGRRRRPARVELRLVDVTAGPAAVTRAAACLSPTELVRAERGTPEVRARRILLRAALRELAGEVLGIAPEAVPLVPRPGRPALEPAADRPDIDLGASASMGIGLVAVGRGVRIGVDVQAVGEETVARALAEGWLADGEARRIATLPAREQPGALTRAWVQKEAVLKGEGVGLWADLSRTVTPVADRGRVSGWRLSPVPVPPGFVACLAQRPASRRASHRERAAGEEA